jgi:hypothetical protein
MQPYFFPYLGYFQLMQAVEKFVVYDDVNYIVRGWLNRNRILVNGKDLMVTLPLRGASQNLKINEIERVKDQKQISKMSRSLRMAYGKSPYFESVHDLFLRIMNSEITNLGAFLSLQLQMIAKHIGIKTLIIETSAHYGNQGLNREERLIDICKKENSAHYINAMGGMELYSKERFRLLDIKLNFLKPQLNPYPQQMLSCDFVAGLSILDIMMNNSIKEISNHLNSYELI